MAVDLNLAYYRFQQLLTKATEHEQLGQFTQASIYWCKAARMLPGNALPFTARCRYLLRNRYGNPAIWGYQEPMNRIFSMSRLGTWGRFGNQLIQYSVLRILADRYSASVETSDWIGRDLFNIQDPLVSDLSRNLIEESTFDLSRAILETDSRFLRDVDLRGHFCVSTEIFSQYRDFICQIFQYRSTVESQLERWRSQLIGNSGNLVALHLRRGDFKDAGYFVAPTSWYHTCLRNMNLNESVLYIASDDQNIYKDFVDYDLVLARDVTDWSSDLDFIFDFYMLSKADVVLISNSTFSFVATMLNNTGLRFYRPDPREEEMIEFDPWSSPIVL